MNKYNMEIEIKAFLKDVEEKLPGWLKDDKFEKREVLNELEEHIWDKAEELAMGGEITLVHVQKAINLMGTPESITREYKKRGTPYIYITKEWWEIYKKVLTIAVVSLIAINLIVFFAQILSVPFWDNFTSIFSGLWNSILPTLVIITVIFVALSIQGYFPEDLSQETSKIKQSISKEIHIEFETKKSLKKVKAPINTKSLLGEGIWGAFWTIMMIIQPIEAINNQFTPEFLEFVRLCGMLGMIEAIIKIFQVFAGIQRIRTQQMLILGMIVVEIFYIQRFLCAVEIPEVLRMFSQWSFDPSGIFRIILWISIVGTAIGCLEKLEKITSYSGKLHRYNAVHERSNSINRD
ncbi:MAG: hypothetical protein K9W44_01825 [Candidatus Lokiarchaeota archaeon]|nr:hypothetical protein [Candidatus Harpocratesius repetitus]